LARSQGIPSTVGESLCQVQFADIADVLDIGKLDVDAEERPLVYVHPLASSASSCQYRPPKIRGIRIVENPFDDIVPRITAAEKRAQQQARLEARKETEVREKRAKAKK